MSMRVHNAEHFEEVRQTAIREATSPRSRSPLSLSGRHSLCSSPFGSSPSPTGSSSKSYASELLRETQQKRVAMKHDLYMREQEAMQRKLADGIAESLQKNKTKREGQYMKLWKEVEDGKALAAELHDKMDMQNQSKHRQVQRMHDEWNTGVYHKLNDPIVQKVAAMSGKELNLQKHDAYQRFLDITNKKGGLFRDIIIESEYDPLSDLKCLTYHTPVDDPVKRVIRRREDEDAIAQQGSGGGVDGGRSSPSKALCRDDNLDVKLWSHGVFESTPYGYFHKMMNSRPTTDGSKAYASRVKFDHYNVEFGAKALKRELPKGKRTNFDGHDAKIPKTTIELR